MQEGREILTQGEDTIELEIDLPGENEELGTEGEGGDPCEYLYSDARRLEGEDAQDQSQQQQGATENQDDDAEENEERKLLPPPEIKGSAFLVSSV